MRRHQSFTAALTSALLLGLFAGTATAQSAPSATPPVTGAEPNPAPAAATEPAAPPLGPDVAPASAGLEPAASATTAAAPDAKPTTADSAAADAELAAVEQQVSDNSTTSSDVKLDLYGFADFSYGFGLTEFSGAYNSFAVGNLNLYLASSLGDSWRSLAEVRFSYLPNGTTQIDSTGQVSRTNTTAADYTDLGRSVQWGGIIIERAYLEYLAHPLANIRVGHFLTPYGIWNVDHGSPVIIGVRRPFIIGEALLPMSQTGVEIYGSHHFDPVEVGYHLTLSNGRGPIDTYQDLNHNKAIGGRLFARADTATAGTLTLGTSAYRGRYTDRTQQFVVDAKGQFQQTSTITLDYNELSLAADLKWELAGMLVQSEAIVNDVVYDRQRPTDLVFSGPPGFQPDYRRIGVYGLAGYRFAFLGTMPFAGAEYYDSSKSGFHNGKSAAFWGGLNVRPTARVVLKAQYTYSWFPGTPKGVADGSHFSAIDLQAAWSF